MRTGDIFCTFRISRQDSLKELHMLPVHAGKMLFIRRKLMHMRK